MYRVIREFRFCYGHRLMGHAGKCRHLHGHNGKAVIMLAAAVQRQDEFFGIQQFLYPHIAD